MGDCMCPQRSLTEYQGANCIRVFETLLYIDIAKVAISIDHVF